jgi:hypothetical protein
LQSAPGGTNVATVTLPPDGLAVTGKHQPRSILRIVLMAMAIFWLTMLGFWCGAYPVYRFPPATAFHGDSLFNPYRTATGTWYKANFHAHSIVWGGTTNATSRLEDVEAAYRSMGYDIIGVSNYQSISRPGRDGSGVVPVYEHGYNIMKTHHLVIGAREVSWLDYVLPQNVHQKQFVLDRLSTPGVAVSLNHPEFRSGFGKDDMESLTGMTLIEVLNHYRQSYGHWDAALSSGRRAWIVGDDDSHDAGNASETGVYWTMVNARSLRTDDIVTAMSAGRTYGVAGRGGSMAIRVKAVETRGMTVTVVLDTVAERIEFIGQRGIVRAVVKNAARASYTFAAEDTYIRVKAAAARNVLYLNPVFRTDGSTGPTASVDWLRSILLWLTAGVAYLFLVSRVAKWGMRPRDKWRAAARFPGGTPNCRP